MAGGPGQRPRFQTPARVTSSSARELSPPSIPALCSLKKKNMCEQVISGGRASFGPTLVPFLPSAFLQGFFFLNLISATLRESLEF